MYRFMTGCYHSGGLGDLMTISRLPYIETWSVTCWLWICHYEYLYIYGISDFGIFNLGPIYREILCFRSYRVAMISIIFWQYFTFLGGIPSIPGALLLLRLSMANLISYSMKTSLMNWWFVNLKCSLRVRNRKRDKYMAIKGWINL